MIDYGELEKGQLIWYEFRDNARICVIEGNHILHHPIINNRTCETVYIQCDSISKIQKTSFDYVVLLDVFTDIQGQWELINDALKSNGILLIITNNRMGAKYFCGDYDYNNKMPFNGMNKYPYNEGKRDFDRQELLLIIENNGYKNCKFYYPVPDFRLLQVVYSDHILPQDDVTERVIFCFEHPEALVMDERELLKTAIRNKVFPFFANSYIIECSREQNVFCDVDYAAVSLDRIKENAWVTAIHGKKYVTKRPIFETGISAINKLKNNMSHLSKMGVPVLDACYSEHEIRMDYVSAMTLANYLRELCQKQDRDGVIRVFDQLKAYIMISSNAVSADKNKIKDLYDVEEWGTILERTYLELIPMNCFYENGNYLFFDQEFVYDNYPASFPLFRGIRYTYKCIPDMSLVITRDELCSRYGISPKMWDALEKEEQKMQIYIKQREKHKAFYERIFLNKENMYKKAFLTDFARDENAINCNNEYILFGAGCYAEQFIKEYNDLCHIRYIVDNNVNLQGQIKWGYDVLSPKVLVENKNEENIIIVCASDKNYIQIARQLKEMGIEKFYQYKKKH